MAKRKKPGQNLPAKADDPMDKDERGSEREGNGYEANSWDEVDQELESVLYARHAEIENLKELAGKDNQRGTPIPALFNTFYKFIQNPSTVSVETFKRMVDTDDTIGSGVDFLTTCLAARLGAYQHPSKEITQWVNKRLDQIEGGFFNLVKEIFSASWAGYYVGEKVWANTDDGFVPQSVVSLPPSTLLFETDRQGRITDDGILQYQRNYNPLMLSAGLGFFGGQVNPLGFTVDTLRPDAYAKLGDLPFPLRTANTYNYLSIRIPKLKCIHYSFDAQGKFGNPYGRSLLRRAYKYYVMKDATLQMMAIALDRKGTPLTVVFADPNTTIVDPTKGDRSTGGGQGVRGQRAGMTAPQAAKEAFRTIHNDTTIVLPGKKSEIFDLQFVPQDANTEAFISALNFLNRSILRALLIPELIFGNGEGTGSNALGEEHGRTLGKILDGMLAGAKQVLREQLIREMIAYNFPESAWKKDGFGDFGKRELDSEEQAKAMEIYDKAVTMGAIDMQDLNDLNKVRESIGFEERTEPIAQPDPFGMPGEENPFDEEGEEIEPDEGDDKNPFGQGEGANPDFPPKPKPGMPGKNPKPKFPPRR